MSSEQQSSPEQQIPPPYLYPDEDEIHLLDYVIVLFNHKWLIMGLVFIAGAAAVYFSLRMTNIYRSEATILPRQEEKSESSTIAVLRGLGGFAGDLVGLGGGGSLDKFEIVLTSRVLAKRIFSKQKDEILPILYQETWDQKEKAWKSNPHPTIQDITKAIRDLLTIKKEKSGILRLQVDSKDPSFAKKMVEFYIIELSESLREETLKDAEENQRFLREQLDQTSDVLLEEKIYAMLAREIEKTTFASAQKYYSFLVVDPPIVPDLNKRVKPKRSQICILSVIVAFFVAVFLAFFLEYIHNITNGEDPERLEKLKNSLKLRRPRKT